MVMNGGKVPEWTNSFSNFMVPRRTESRVAESSLMVPGKPDLFQNLVISRCHISSIVC